MSQVLSCSHFPVCSGCTAIDTPYERQLERKLAAVQAAFTEASLPDFDVRSIRRIAPSPSPSGYRNRVRLVPAWAPGVEGKPRGIHLGLYRAGSHQVIDIPGCPVQAVGLNAAVEVVREAITAADLSLYDEVAICGDLRFVSLRQGMRTAQVLVGVVTRDERCEGLDRFVEQVTRRCADVVGVIQNINPQPGNVIFGPRTRVLAGRAYMEEEVCGLKIRLGLTSFFQVNTDMAERAYRAILAQLELDRRTTLLDLYSGIGSIGLVASSAVHRVIGIETSDEAVEFAQQSAAANGVGHCEFKTGRVEQKLQPVIAELGRIGLSRGQLAVVVNPPRKGLDPVVVDMLGKVGPGRIAYLSCSVASLLNDLALFIQRGYRVRHVELFDMFPQTEQVEALAILQMRGPTIPRVSGRVRKRPKQS